MATTWSSLLSTEVCQTYTAKCFILSFICYLSKQQILTLSKYSSCTHVNICWCAPGWAARHWWGSWVSGTWTGGRRSWWTCLQCPGRRSPVPTQPLLSMLPRRLGASVSVCPHRQPSPAQPSQRDNPEIIFHIHAAHGSLSHNQCALVQLISNRQNQKLKVSTIMS